MKIFTTKNDTDCFDTPLQLNDKVTIGNIESVFSYGYDKFIDYVYEDKQPIYKG